MLLCEKWEKTCENLAMCCMIVHKQGSRKTLHVLRVTSIPVVHLVCPVVFLVNVTFNIFPGVTALGMPQLALGWWGQAAVVASAVLVPGGVAAGSLQLILSFAFQRVYLALVSYL